MKLLITIAAALAFSGAAHAQIACSRMLSGVNYQGGNYSFQPGDVTQIVAFSSTLPLTATLNAGTSISAFGPCAELSVVDYGTSTVTIICAGCSMNGFGSLQLTPGTGVDIYGDGVNFVAVQGGGGAGAGVQYGIPGTYVLGATQSFPAGTIVLPPTNAASNSWSAGTLYTCLSEGIEGVTTSCLFDGANYSFLLNNSMSVNDLGPGATGTPGSPAVNADSPQLTGHPGIANSIFSQLSDPTAPNGDWVDMGPGVGGSPGCHWTPTATHGQQCVDSAGHWKFSHNGDGPFTVQRMTASSATDGVATMTAETINAGACGTTTTIADANISTADVATGSSVGAVAANPGVLTQWWWTTSGHVNTHFCNPTASSVTVSSGVTFNWIAWRTQ